MSLYSSPWTTPKSTPNLLVSILLPILLSLLLPFRVWPFGPDGSAYPWSSFACLQPGLYPVSNIGVLQTNSGLYEYLLPSVRWAIFRWKFLSLLYICGFCVSGSSAPFSMAAIGVSKRLSNGGSYHSLFYSQSYSLIYSLYF